LANSPSLHPNLARERSPGRGAKPSARVVSAKPVEMRAPSLSQKIPDSRLSFSTGRPRASTRCVRPSLGPSSISRI